MEKRAHLLALLLLVSVLVTAGHAAASAPKTQTDGSEDSGLFWFFQPDNWEVLVKVLDGCKLTNHFWVFAAATTNVEYTLTVTDTLTDESKSYKNPLGTAAPATTDTMALATCSAVTSLVSCTPSDTRLCLQDRFAVRIDWRDFQGETGVGHVVPITRFEPQLRLFVNPKDLYVTDTSEVVVLATGGAGEPLGGQHVRLFADSGTIGRDLMTDPDGEATAIYDAGIRPGEARITAVLGASTATADLTVRDAPGFVLVTTNPASIPSSGGDLDVEAIVLNPQGQALSGVVVRFVVVPGIGSFQSGTNIRVTAPGGYAHDRLLVSQEELGGLRTLKVLARVNRGETVLEAETTVFIF